MIPAPPGPFSSMLPFSNSGREEATLSHRILGQLCLGWEFSLLSSQEELRDLSSKIHNQLFPVVRLELFFKNQGNVLLGIFGRQFQVCKMCEDS